MPTKEEQQIIVDRHNKLRAELGNDVDKEPMPANMRYMVRNIKNNLDIL